MTYIIRLIPDWLIPAAIAVLSLLTVAIILERVYYYFLTIRSYPDSRHNELLHHLKQGQISEARSIAESLKRPVYQFATGWLKSRQNNDPQADNPENLVARIQRQLEVRIQSLGTISTVAPLLGLLGTVTGMIKSFYAFENKGSDNATQIMGGIDEALITTCFGLIVAIPAIIAYNFFVRLANEHTSEIRNLIPFLPVQSNARAGQTSDRSRVSESDEKPGLHG